MSFFLRDDNSAQLVGEYPDLKALQESLRTGQHPHGKYTAYKAVQTFEMMEVPAKVRLSTVSLSKRGPRKPKAEGEAATPKAPKAKKGLFGN